MPDRFNLGLQDDPPADISDKYPDPIDWEGIYLSPGKPPIPRPGSNWSDYEYDAWSLPKKVDWRDKWGVDWITTVQVSLSIFEFHTVSHGALNTG